MSAHDDVTGHVPLILQISPCRRSSGMLLTGSSGAGDSSTTDLQSGAYEMASVRSNNNSTLRLPNMVDGIAYAAHPAIDGGTTGARFTIDEAEETDEPDDDRTPDGASVHAADEATRQDEGDNTTNLPVIAQPTRNGNTVDAANANHYSTQRDSSLPKPAHQLENGATPIGNMHMEAEINLNNKATAQTIEAGGAPTDEEEPSETYQLCPCLPCCPVVRGANPPSCDAARSGGGCIEWLKFILRWILFIPSFPFLVLFSWTVPDCSQEHNKKWFIVSFLSSVLWIAVLSFAMVSLVGRVGCILNVDNYIMGLCVIAVGTSLPDAISSILVAREGYGDMAVSNAIGSNVFDINLGIGLPFIIRIAIDHGSPISLLDRAEWVEYNSGEMTMIPHVKFGFILLLILILALTMFVIAGFHLNRSISITFVIIYAAFVAYALIQEIYCFRKLGMYC